MTNALLTRTAPSTTPHKGSTVEGASDAFLAAWEAELEAWDYASLADVETVAHKFSQVELPLIGRRYALRFSPGTLAVRTTDAHRSLYVEQLPGWEHPTLFPELEKVPPVRDMIIRWSANSRRRMVRTIAELDLSDWDGSAGPLAMVTLTYPGDWLTVAPDAKTAKKHLAALRRRWERRIGPFRAIWKQEFQRRGAPHFHFLARVPAKVGNRTFEKWLSHTWAEIVNHPDPHQKALHRRAGTGVDFSGVKFSDPRRAAVYFLKHSSKTTDDKEYQHDVPREWRETGAGRFWGYYGFTKAVVEVYVTRDMYYATARILRKLAAARRASADMLLLRQVGHHHTIAKGMRRRRNRRGYGGGGWCLVHDGVFVAYQVLAALENRSTAVLRPEPSAVLVT